MSISFERTLEETEMFPAGYSPFSDYSGNRELYADKFPECLANSRLLAIKEYPGFATLAKRVLCPVMKVFAEVRNLPDVRERVDIVRGIIRGLPVTIWGIDKFAVGFDPKSREWFTSNPGWWRDMPVEKLDKGLESWSVYFDMTAAGVEGLHGAFVRFEVAEDFRTNCLCLQGVDSDGKFDPENFFVCPIPEGGTLGEMADSFVYEGGLADLLYEEVSDRKPVGSKRIWKRDQTFNGRRMLRAVFGIMAPLVCREVRELDTYLVETDNCTCLKTGRQPMPKREPDSTDVETLRRMISGNAGCYGMLVKPEIGSLM